MKNVNHERMKCGSLYNEYLTEMIIFGGIEKDLIDLPWNLQLLNKEKGRNGAHGITPFL